MGVKTSIIIPAYKEVDGLSIVLPKVFSVIDDTYEVIVVDDGSGDDTAKTARQFSCRVIEHEVNRGKGNALKTGIKEAKGENIIWIDADDTYPSEVVPLISKGLEHFDMVVCSRAWGKRYIPLFDRVGLAIFRILIKGVYGFKADDPCTGLYGAKKVCLERMRLMSSRFTIEPEISIKGGRMGLKTLDIPIVYSKRAGTSKLNAVKVGSEDLMMIARLVFWKP